MILKTTYLQSIHSVAILIQGVHEMHFGDGVVKQKKAVWPVQGINFWLINLKLSQHTYYNVLPLATISSFH